MIDTLVIHHTGFSSYKWAEEFIEPFTEDHWAFPYNILIDKRWTYVEPIARWKRAGSTMVESVNQRSVQVCLVWNFMNEGVTDKQKVTLLDVVPSILDEFNIQHIKWHRDVQATACPWDDLYEIVLKLKNNKMEKNIVENGKKEQEALIALLYSLKNYYNYWTNDEVKGKIWPLADEIKENLDESQIWL